MNDETVVVHRGTPGETEAGFEVPALDRSDVLRCAAAAGILERRHEERSECGGRSRQCDRGGERERLRQVRQERTLQVVLFGSRQLQSITHAQVQRQVRLHLPVVLDERRGCVPAVVVLEQSGADGNLVRNTEQVAGKRVAAVRGAGGTENRAGLRHAEVPASAGGGEKRLHVQQFMGQVNAELPAHRTMIPVDLVDDVVAFFDVVVVG